MAELAGYTYVAQSIDLIPGWNILSFNTVPSDMDFISILQPLIDDSVLVKLQNEQGQAVMYLPGYGWFNGIGNMLPGEGYYVNVSNTDTLIVTEQADNCIANNVVEPQTQTNNRSRHFIPCFI